ncbi:MAG: zinc ribbon domain-containing protein, partial [Deltaproteobacteria bacterium]|nr:zinc ribbon domain-containing protein [Deltaproteobacteria bacterium]
MPIYEYICESCHNELEVIQKISEAQLKDCPQCHEPSLKRKASMSAFHLKGGDWYKDGYGNTNVNANNDSKKPAATTPAAGTTPAPTPAAKTESSP